MRLGITNSQSVPILQREWVIVLLLFILSLLPRAIGLDIYYTVDEDTYLNRSYQFLQALTRGDWQATFVNDATPGITTQWAGALGIWLYRLPQDSHQQTAIQAGGESLPDAERKSLALLAFARYPTALLGSIFVVGVYLLLRKAVNGRIALLAASFLAFDTFLISLTRVLGNDALHAMFAVFAVLCFGRAGQTRARLWFAVSGACAGLAVLSKSPALILVPLALFLSIALHLLGGDESRGWKSLAANLALWFGAMLLAIFMFWPSMWVQPLDTFKRVFQIAADNVDQGNSGGTYFWGQPVIDPGPFFYPVAILLRLPSVLLLGAVITLASLGSRLKAIRKRPLDSETRWLLVLWATPLVYLVMLTLAARKSERHILPVFLALDILGAIGCLILLDRAAARWFKHRQRLVAGAGGALLVLVQIYCCVSTHPYYFSFYNPLLGGARTAMGVLPLGWGEGMEQAGRYLDAKANAQDLRVGTRWTNLFEKYFRGQAKGFPPRTTPQRYWPVELDYAAIYASDLQRYGLPRTFRELYPTPELAVNINGVDYVSVYDLSKDKLQSLPAGVTPLKVQYTDGLSLVGYGTYPPQEDSGRIQYELPMTLYWRVSEVCLKDYRFTVRLVNSAGTVWGTTEIDPPCAGWNDAWRKDLIFPDEISLPIDRGTPPGAYDVEMRVPEHRQIAPAADSPVRLGPVEVPRQPSLTSGALDMARVVNAKLSQQAVLLGCNLNGEVQPGRTLKLTVFWQALRPIDRNYTVFIHVVDGLGTLVGQADSEPVSGFYPTTRWTPGEIVRDQYEVVLPPDLNETQAHLLIGMYLASTGDRLPVTLSDGGVPDNRAVTLALPHDTSSE
jgi:4-amino-4-deoxy-L-arabinose transferase-like glycosyltransferase